MELKPHHKEYQPLPPASSKYTIGITDQKKENRYGVACVMQKTNQDKT
jgi:hypothetical protein